MQPVIFDFNGTMFLDTAQNEIAWRQIMREGAGLELTADDFKNFLHGSPDVEIVKHYINPHMSMDEARSWANRKEKLYRQLCREDKSNLKLTAGLPAYLDSLKERQIPHNIATGADRDNLDFYLDQLNLARWFDPDKIVFSDGSFKGKPAPDIYLLAAEKIGVNVHDCLVFEDAYLGVKSAAAAGVKRIIGLCAIPANEFLYNMPEVEKVISDFTGWKTLL